MTTKGTPYKQAKLDEKWDAIVIGSGIGGLAAAVLLGQHGGKRVLVLERHYEAGGFTHTFHRPGYQWDVGVHYIGEMQDEAPPVAPRLRPRHWRPVSNGSPCRTSTTASSSAGRRTTYAAGVENFAGTQAVVSQRSQGHRCDISQRFRHATAPARLYYAEKAIPRRGCACRRPDARPIHALGQPDDSRCPARPDSKSGTDRRARLRNGATTDCPRKKQLCRSRHHRRALF